MSELIELREKVEEITGWHIQPMYFKLIHDTSDWADILRGQVLRLNGRDFIIRGNMRETRFGIGDQPKYWVFSAIDMATQQEKIIKTVFYEEFHTHIGIFRIRCYRSPEKEGDVLQYTRGDLRFMQGETFYDVKHNNVRVIDYIRGQNLFDYIPSIDKTHEQYFYEDLPDILWNIQETMEAIQLLHQNGMCHGDIRNDHIYIDSKTKQYRWIDFDLQQDVTDFDMWSLGNIISYAAGKGIRSFKKILKTPKIDDKIKNSLSQADASAFYEYRIMNLKKIFPYLPERLNRILEHFLIQPKAFYSNIAELLHDYGEMLENDFPRKPL